MRHCHHKTIASWLVGHCLGPLEALRSVPIRPFATVDLLRPREPTISNGGPQRRCFATSLLPEKALRIETG